MKEATTMMTISPNTTATTKGPDDDGVVPTNGNAMITTATAKKTKKKNGGGGTQKAAPTKRKRPPAKHAAQPRHRGTATGAHSQPVLTSAEPPSSTTSANASGVPVRPLSAYNFFFRDERGAWLAEREAKQERSSDVFCSMGKEIGARWKALGEERVAYYKQMAKEDAERYKRDRKLYIQRETKQAWKDFEAKQEPPTVPGQTQEVSCEESVGAGDSLAVQGDQDDSERTAAATCSPQGSPLPASAGLRTLSELAVAVEGQGDAASYLPLGRSGMRGPHHYAASHRLPQQAYPPLHNPFVHDPDPYTVQHNVVSSLVRDNMMLRHILSQQQQPQQQPMACFHLPMPAGAAATAAFPVHPAAAGYSRAGMPPLLAGGASYDAGVRYVWHHPASASAAAAASAASDCAAAGAAAAALSPAPPSLLGQLPPTQFPILSQLSASDIAFLMQKYHQDDSSSSSSSISTSSRAQQQHQYHHQQQVREDDDSEQVAATRHHRRRMDTEDDENTESSTVGIELPGRM